MISMQSYFILFHQIQCVSIESIAMNSLNGNSSYANLKLQINNIFQATITEENVSWPNGFFVGIKEIGYGFGGFCLWHIVFIFKSHIQCFC